MINKILLFTTLICSSIFFGQTETCDTPDDNLLSDLNSITKCSIEKDDTNANDKSVTKSVAVVVRSRRRVIRKREVANGLSSNTTRGINKINSKSNITENLNLEVKNNTSAVPFSLVEEIPLFKKCENSPLLQQKACFKKELFSHVRKNFKYPEKAYSDAVQGRVFVYFTINNDGTIGEMKINAPYKGELLGKEAERIIKKLPDFKPAKHNGGNVVVKYALPISFTIPGVRPSNIRKNIRKEEVTTTYAFNQTETIPLFKSCKDSNNSSLDCYNAEFVKHIEKNFAYPQEAVNKNIEGIVNVKFIINQRGNVMNVEAKGPQNGKILETAARILVEKLPKFKPATKDGKSVNATYSFPVNFQLD